MTKRKGAKGVESLNDVFRNKSRASILRLCLYSRSRDKLTLSQIERIMKLGHGTLIYHISILKKFNLISLVQNEKERGKPVYVKADLKNVENIIDKDDKRESKKVKTQVHKILEDSKEEIKYILKKISENKGEISRKDIRTFNPRLDWFLIENLVREGVLDNKVIITKKGEELLKKLESIQSL